MTLNSPCKINLLLNILGKRADGFHELETIMHPVRVCDQLTFQRIPSGISLTCSDSQLPTGPENLVYKAAALFLETTKIRDGVAIHLEKRIPVAAGLGGGSGNAATTLKALNQLFEYPADNAQMNAMAASLGSDIPFFLQDGPALGTGRGEIIQPLAPFPILEGTSIILVQPGFGISTPWAYGQLARFPEALHGQPGRAQKLIDLLQTGPLETAADGLYNSLEAPALEKYPLLALFQDFFRENGAVGTLMSGSGSASFALVRGQRVGEILLEMFKSRFGDKLWTALVPMSVF
jgi:4-diphosphocytidyl-2-C-methyl-D-erythritol kinase